MPQLNVELKFSFGDSTDNGNTPCREVFTQVTEYTQIANKELTVPAGSTDLAINLDTITTPKFMFISSEEGNVQIKVGNGTGGEEATLPAYDVNENAGFQCIVNNVDTGFNLNTIYITTPVSPTTGARIRLIGIE